MMIQEFMELIDSDTIFEVDCIKGETFSDWRDFEYYCEEECLDYEDVEVYGVVLEPVTRAISGRATVLAKISTR